nr:MAG TPA: hypothetical protein [Bacteriophage sp.]
METKELLAAVNKALELCFGVHLSEYGEEQITRMAVEFEPEDIVYSFQAACEQYPDPMKAVSMAPCICKKRRLIRKMLVFKEEKENAE